MEHLQSTIAFILAHNLFKKNRRRAFFLLLNLAPPNKYVSKFFIRDKIEEAFLADFLPEEVYLSLGEDYLENIRMDFYHLSNKGWVERIDMSPRSEKEFERFCKAHMAGSYCRRPFIKRTQIFQRITCSGKKRIKEILNGKV